MTRDYARKHGKTQAGKPGSRARAKSKPARKQVVRGVSRAKPRPGRKRTSADQTTSFSAPSFSAGVVFGAALVLLAAYAPTLFQETVSVTRSKISQPEPKITFNFPDILRENQVVTDPDAYPVEFPDSSATEGLQEYLIQAASLRAEEDATVLQVQLRKLGLPAQYNRVTLQSGVWFRVTVGPYDSKRDANRAMTQLREQNLSALLIKLGNL